MERDSLPDTEMEGVVASSQKTVELRAVHREISSATTIAEDFTQLVEDRIEVRFVNRTKICFLLFLSSVSLYLSFSFSLSSSILTPRYCGHHEGHEAQSAKGDGVYVKSREPWERSEARRAWSDTCKSHQS